MYITLITIDFHTLGFCELFVVHFSLLATRRSAAAVCAPATCSLTA